DHCRTTTDGLIVSRSGPASPQPPAVPSSRVRLAAVLLACPIIVLDNLWVVWMERVARGPYVTTISLFGNAVFLLALLIGANALLRRRAPRLALSQAELLLIYSMVRSPPPSPGWTWSPSCSR